MENFMKFLLKVMELSKIPQICGLIQLS